MNLSVIELNHIDTVTDTDREYGIDEWAKMFKATTWEEIKMLAEKNEYIDSAAREMFKREQDNKFIDLCRKTEEEIAGEEYRRKRITELEEALVERDAAIANKDAIIAATIADKDATIARMQAEIERLQNAERQATQ